MRDIIENDIVRLRSAIKSKHLSVHKELYDSILQTYDTVIPGLTVGLENAERQVEVVAPFRKKPTTRSTRLNGDLLRANLGKLATRLEIFLEDGGVSDTDAPPEFAAPIWQDIAEQSPLPAPPPPPSREQIKSADGIDVAIRTVQTRTDLSPERREDFMGVLTQIKEAIVHEPDKRERWKLIRPLLSWAYKQTDPSIASDVLFLISESIG